jgi:hypothetical protein
MMGSDSENDSNSPLGITITMSYLLSNIREGHILGAADKVSDAAR